MQRNSDGWNIVLLGFWNRMIFTPEWVSPRLFPGPQIETMIALLPVMPLIYRDDDVAMEISASRLIFRPRRLDDEAALRKAGNMAATVLRSLPETPVKGIGINFGFTEDHPGKRILELFEFEDNALLGEQRWTVSESNVSRRLCRGDDVLNLKITLNGQALNLDCNFHTETDSNVTAVAAVEEDRIVELRDAAFNLLEAIYGLELEQVHGDA